jgi:hypothetical protein
MVLTPEQFTGKAPVMAEPFDMEPGTEIAFAWDQAESARGYLALTARYCPVPVYFEGERLEQQDFLDGAVHVETWNGVRIGVFKRAYWTGKPTINFHGLTLDTRLPDINMAMERAA